MVESDQGEGQMLERRDKGGSLKGRIGRQEKITEICQYVNVKDYLTVYV